MAEQVKITLTCDWHSLMGEHSVTAAAKRSMENRNEVDLCEPCALVWDIAFPRRRQFEVFPQLLGAARTPVEQRTPRTKVLTAGVEEAPAHGTQDTLPLPEQRTGDVPTTALMVDCMLCGDPVRYGNRGDHAKKKHDSTLERVPYRPVGFTYEAICGGACGVEGCVAGYTTKKGLDGHVNKLSQRGTAASAQSKQQPAVEKKSPNNGRRDTSVPQVTCPLEHRSDAKPYFVNLKNRAGHADHHGVHITDIQWGNDAGLTWGARCTVHPKCAAYDNGEGFPFPSPESRNVHINKETAKARKLAEAEPPERPLSAVAA